jgi:hypothetical protein
MASLFLWMCALKMICWVHMFLWCYGAMGPHGRAPLVSLAPPRGLLSFPLFLSLSLVYLGPSMLVSRHRRCRWSVRQHSAMAVCCLVHASPMPGAISLLVNQSRLRLCCVCLVLWARSAPPAQKTAHLAPPSVFRARCASVLALRTPCGQPHTNLLNKQQVVQQGAGTGDGDALPLGTKGLQPCVEGRWSSTAESLRSFCVTWHLWS